MVDPTLAGLVGGFAGTAAMSAPMMLMMGDDPSPTQVLMSKVNRKPPEENQMPGMALHFLYGTVGGLVLAILVEAFLDPVASYSTAEFTVIGLGWGFILWLGSFFWMGILGLAKEMMEQPMGERLQQMGGMFGMHLLYGAVVGLVTIWLV